jgi:hypothetical protein
MKNISLALIAVLLLPAVLVGVTASVSTTGIHDYDPWCDLDDDGDIDIFDIVDIANRYGTTGTPVNKTELLYNVSDTLADLLTQIETLQAQITTMTTNIVEMNNTLTYLSETSTRFLYSDGLPVDLWIDSGIKDTGWVTVKSVAIPPNTLLNRTVLLLLSWMAYKTLSPQYLGFGRLTVNNVTVDSWDIYMIQHPEPYDGYEAHFTTYEVKRLDNVDNSVEVTINLQLKIDSYGTVYPSYARIVATEFRVFG